MQQGLLSAFNPSDALPAPRYTGMLLPIERDMYGNKGNFELAVPQFLQDAYSGINKFGQVFRGELSPQEIQKLAFDTSMNVTGGSLLGSRVIPNAVPSGGILGMGVSSSNKSLKSIDDIKRNYPNVDLDIYSSPKGLTLSKIVVPKEARSEGVGSSVMSDLVKYADENNLPIALTPDTSFGGNKTRLKSFYKNFGFVDNKGRNKDFSFRETMIRQPESGLLSQTNQVTPETGLLGKVDNVQPQTGIAEVVPPTDKADGIFAFHGSGADFDDFKLSKIGTGEGNQAFGYGLYFTDSEDIAKFYKNTVTFQDQTRGKLNLEYKGEKFIDLGDTAQAENASTEYRVLTKLKEDMASYLPANPKLATPQEAKNRLLKRLDVEINKYSKAGQTDSDVGTIDLADGSKLEDLITKSLQNEKDALLKIDPNDINVVSGKTYEVKINAVMDDLIDYDKSLRQQNNKVKKILKPYYEYYGVAETADFGTLLESTYRHLPQDEFSERLAKEGIKGIKYLDNSARNTFGGKLLSVDKTPDGFKAKVVLDDPSRQTGVGGSGRVITTSKPYKTEKEARDWAKKSIEKDARNYVIFDDKIIDIMKKYGIVGAVGVTAMQGGEQSPEANLSL